MIERAFPDDFANGVVSDVNITTSNSVDTESMTKGCILATNGKYGC